VTLQPYMLRSISSPGAVKHARHTPLEVDIDVAHAEKVEHQPVVAERAPRHGVAAGPHRDRQAVVARERQRRNHVDRSRTAGQEPRPPLDHGVEPGASLDVLWIAGFEQPAAQPEAQAPAPTSVPCGHAATARPGWYAERGAERHRRSALARGRSGVGVDLKRVVGLDHCNQPYSELGR
jgi:hypothetical protein